ncbi:MAG: insulinase family protein [Lutibacter sp.]|uniref:M16 family metallopeptidase n=1 Tax=Lutibacter sp. TaxID=1925666 RepID=UPI0017AA0761|nr:pitrilysin family protein [Lutibacter sp.]MBT8318457.1 insulinase family protein [Lutibacter sp.]NNJ59315.1 insulinase family protein [Lutibacter sp.]
MKTKITTLIALFLLSLGVTAQIDRTKQPKAGPAPKINLGKPKTFELKNGLKVLVVENHKLPKVTASLILDNGPIFEGDKAGLTSIVGGMMGNGTTNIPKDEFVEEIDFLGASLNIGSQSASFNTLSKYFPRILELMADATQNPLFTEEEFGKQQTQLIEGIKSGENSVGEIASKVENALVYGKNHPYGEFASESTANNVTIDDVKNFYATYFKPANGYLVIIGDVNFKDVKKLVKKNFDKWEKGTVPAYTIPEVTNVAETEINFVNMPNAVQSSIAVVNTVDLKMSNPDYFPLLLANKIFGGGGEGRLFLNLREDKGYTYGAYSSIGNNERTSSKFKSSASVRNMVTDSAVVEFIKEIKTFRDTKVSDEELKNAKAAYIGNFVMALERTSTAANYALNIATKNLSEDFYETYLEKINAVTSDDIQRVAQKYFSADNARIVIVGKALDVLPNLEKMPYKINYFDKEANATDKPEMTKPIPAGVTKQTVIDTYLNAIGGAEKLKALESTLVTYEASAMGSTIKSTEKRTSTKYANETSMGGNVLAKVVMTNDGVFMNKQPLPPAMANDMKKTIGTFVEIGMLNDESATLTGIEPLDGKDAYVILSKGEVVSMSVYFDVETGLKVKEAQVVSMNGQTQNQEATFSNYQEFNGVKFPGTKIGSLGPQKVEFKLIDAKVNEGVSESDFE